MTAIARTRFKDEQMNPLQDTKQLLRAAPELYHRLILLVGPTGTGKTETLKELLQGISRNRTVVASWNGHASGQKLVYAEPGHAEHRNYELGDVMIVQMSGQSLVGSNGG